MSKHTPGPWVAKPDPNACQPDDWCVGLSGSEANIDKVAVCSKQDAHLIAAAPDLLEALKKVNDAACYASEEDTETREAALLMIGQLARAAIARAEGEV
jgi:hypothetical protein